MFFACICGRAALAGVGLVEFTCDGQVVFEGERSVKTTGIHGVTTSLALEAGTWRVGEKVFEMVSGEVLRLGELRGKNSRPAHETKPSEMRGKLCVTTAEKQEWRIWGEDVWHKGSSEITLHPGVYRLEWRENETIQQRPLVVDEAQPLILTLPQMTEVFIEPTTEGQVFVGPKREGASMLGDVAVLANKTSEIVSWKRLEKAAEKISRIIEPTMPLVSLDPLAMATKTAPFRNSLGMAFVPAGTPGVFFSAWETRAKDFEAFVEESGHDAISENAHGEPAYTLESRAEWKQAGGSWRDPRFPAKQSGEHPVVCVSYLDAEAFCAWLTKKERASGKISATASYRLPSDSEWSRACGGSEYPWGETYPPKSADGNYLGAEGMVGALAGRSTELSQAGFRDGAARTSAVGMFKENRFGLYDMGGNVYEWCNTWYTADLNDEETKKELSFLKDDQGGMTYRVLRGASWNADGRVCLRSSYRFYGPPAYRRASYGFRCVLVVAGAPPIATSSLPTGNAPPAPAIPADLPATGFFEREELFATGPYADYNTYSQTTILKQVQEQLKKRGHYTGSADGSRGPNTQSGILAYQRANSLPVSGRLDPATLSSLGLTGIQPLTAPKPISKPAAPTKPRAVSDDFFISQ